MKRLPILLGLLGTSLVSWGQNPAPEPRFDWTEYQVIMWTGDSVTKQPEKFPLFWKRMTELGVTAGMVHGDGDLKPLLAAKFPYYVENMVNRGLCLKWNSQAKDWDKLVTAWKGPRDEAGLVREFCFDDPTYRSWGRKEMQSLVRKNAPNRPLLYDIRDELSVTQSANPFDYDFHPLALAGFRTWLKGRYASLEALNAGWETNFKTWDEVKPFTTDQIKNRMASGDAIPRGKPDWQAVQQLKFDPLDVKGKLTAWNLSPWADHRSYMDASLSGMLGDLRSAAREIDPKTPVGIEGTQMPSAFGGYDLYAMSKVLDWVEPYDVCDAREIFGSFMAGKPMLTTVGEQDAKAAQRRLWHLLLLGDKGCIIWWSEDCIDWKSEDYALTPRAKGLAPVFKELRSPMARLFMRAQRETDPIAIHYSQASIQVAWLLESTVDGSTWLRRFSSYESAHNRHAQVRHAWLETLEDLGYSPRFVSTEQIEQGALKDYAALVLPQSWALSDGEVKAISAWRSAPHVVLQDTLPGSFDEHGKLRERTEISGPAVLGGVQALGSKSEKHRFPGEFHELARDRVKAEPPAAWYAWLAANVPVPLAVKVPATARVQTHRYRLGSTRLLAFERNLSYSMGEDLKQAGGTKVFEQPIEVTADLPAKAHAYDLRTGKYLGETEKLKFTLDPWQPTLIALTAAKLPEGDVVAQLQALVK
jgi:hypothetical protein